MIGFKQSLTRKGNKMVAIPVILAVVFVVAHLLTDREGEYDSYKNGCYKRSLYECSNCSKKCKYKTIAGYLEKQI